MAWLNGDALVLINILALRLTQLILGRVTVYEQVHHLGL